MDCPRCEGLLIRESWVDPNESGGPCRALMCLNCGNRIQEQPGAPLRGQTAQGFKKKGARHTDKIKRPKGRTQWQ